MHEKTKKEIGSRLKEFGESRYKTLKEFAEALEMHPSSLISKYFSGSSIPGGEFLTKLSALGCDIYWLLLGIKQSTGNIIRERGITYVAMDDALRSESIYIEYPILANVPAGRSEIKEHDWPEYVKLELDPRDYFALRIDEEYGVSMAPFIEPGDLIFCSVKQKFNDGDIVVARYDNTKGAIKRIFIHTQITLISFNPTEHPIVINKKQLEHVYKVVLIWKKK